MLSLKILIILESENITPMIKAFDDFTDIKFDDFTDIYDFTDI